MSRHAFYSKNVGVWSIRKLMVNLARSLAGMRGGTQQPIETSSLELCSMRWLLHRVSVVNR